MSSPSIAKLFFTAKPLVDQITSNESLLKKSISCAQRTFMTIGKNLGMGILLNIAAEPLFFLANRALHIEDVSIVDKCLSAGFSLSFLIRVITMAAVIEEILFRGVLQKGTKTISKYFLSKKVSLKIKGKDEIYSSEISRIVSSVLFGFVHLYNNSSTIGQKAALIQTLHTALLGYFFISKAYEKNGLIGSIALHTGTSLSALCLDYFRSINFQKSL